MGKVKQASFLGGGCESCAAGPSCGMADCADPACGCAAPSCGLAGAFLGGCFGAGPGGCGATIEPHCGSEGLGYAGGFGLCGGSCDSCGQGGYMGRNLQKVTPCACGGSLIGDMARGLIHLVDRAVGATVATFFGGLQKVTCHASGTLAALQCAAAAACDSCGAVGCDGYCAGPVCGLPDPGCGCDISAACGVPAGGVPTELAAPMDYPVSTPSYAAPATDGGYSRPMQPTAAPMMESVPAPPSVPTPAADGGDPFMDDSVPTPQARAARLPRASGYRVFEAGPAAQQQSKSRIVRRSVLGDQPQSAVRKASHSATPALQHRYFQAQGRPATLRR